MAPTCSRMSPSGPATVTDTTAHPALSCGVVEECLPEGEETLEDLKSALSTCRLHRRKSPPAGPIQCRMEQLGLTSREVVVHRSSGSIRDGQDLFERRALDALGGQENHGPVDHVRTYALAWAHSFSPGTRNRRSPSMTGHYARFHSSAQSMQVVIQRVEQLQQAPPSAISAFQPAISDAAVPGFGDVASERYAPPTSNALSVVRSG